MIRQRFCRSQRGFSLIELSIVLVIIGMVVGGVVGGRSLVESARFQSIVREINGFKTAINAFSAQYNYLPGDFPEAYEYWGAAVGCTDGWVSDDEDNCNGNGDGFLGYSSTYTGDWWRGDMGEGIRAWQHLSQAEILPQSYTGKREDTNPRLLIGQTIPRTRWNNEAGYMFEGGDDPYGDTRHYLQLGAEMDDYGGSLDKGTFTAQQALKMDKKMDDGIANQGDIRGYRDQSGGPDDCVSAAYDSMDPVVTYVLSSVGKCFVHIYGF